MQLDLNFWHRSFLKTIVGDLPVIWILPIHAPKLINAKMFIMIIIIMCVALAPSAPAVLFQ